MYVPASAPQSSSTLSRHQGSNKHREFSLRKCSDLNSKEVSPLRLSELFLKRFLFSAHTSPACKSPPMLARKPGHRFPCVCGSKVERKQAFVCWGEVSLVLSISSRGDKKTDGTGGSEGHAMADSFVYLACL